jgi:hypothetical protein
VVDLDALRKALADSGPPDGSTHLTEETWERLACDELSPDDYDAAIDHILDCFQCAEIYRALNIVRSDAAAFDPGAPEMPPGKVERFRSKRGLWGGLSALAVAAAVMMAIFLPGTSTEPPETAGPVVRSDGSSKPATPTEPVNRDVSMRSAGELRLRWSAESELPAVVEILDAEGELIWRSPETTASEVRWPADLPSRPGRYYWRVVVSGAGDKKISSDLVSFRVVD